MVEIANALISRNQRLAPKVLNVFPQNGDGEVYIVQHNSVADEIDTLAGYVDWYLQNHLGVPAGEVLILVNRRVIGNGIRDALNIRAQQNNRPWSAQSFYFEDALSTAIAAEGFSLLTLLVDPETVRHFGIGLGRTGQIAAGSHIRGFANTVSKMVCRLGQPWRCWREGA